MTMQEYKTLAKNRLNTLTTSDLKKEAKNFCLKTEFPHDLLCDIMCDILGERLSNEENLAFNLEMEAILDKDLELQIINKAA